MVFAFYLWHDQLIYLLEIYGLIFDYNTMCIYLNVNEFLVFFFVHTPSFYTFKLICCVFFDCYTIFLFDFKIIMVHFLFITPKKNWAWWIEIHS